jgi:hypothetical protein
MQRFDFYPKTTRTQNFYHTTTSQHHCTTTTQHHYTTTPNTTNTQQHHTTHFPLLSRHGGGVARRALGYIYIYIYIYILRIDFNPHCALLLKLPFRGPFQETPFFLPGTFRDSVFFE